MTIKHTLTKIGVVCLAASVLLTGCGKKDVAATVNGKDISIEDYEREYKMQAQQAMAQYGEDFLTQKTQDGKQTMGEMMRQNTLDNLVRFEIYKQDAESKGIKISDKDVDAEFDKMVKMYGGEEKLQAALKENNLTEEKMKEYTKTNLLMQQYQEKMMKEMEPTEKELKKYYDDHKDEFKTAEASHILVKTKEEAEAIKKELDGGADFAKLAKEKSLDTGSAQNGGSLGQFTPGQMVKEFDEKVFSMKPGEISDPVKTQFGYHIIKLDKISNDFNSAKDAVKEAVIRDKFKEYNDKLEKDAKVKRLVNTAKDIPVEPIKVSGTKGQGNEKADAQAKNTQEQNAGNKTEEKK
ncbi:peptidylprolyl isomerase [Aedoeadaptatus urinae]|uniref:peptidylprolyl isomerase n=1 Tax=Aedoeadaptatus urinae TaxID=1871017 RepID=UPI00097E0734|nr:peptidylprolyl isomerase [Peptoniphilus urinae]